jgi:hypothetical protein
VAAGKIAVRPLAGGEFRRIALLANQAAEPSTSAAAGGTARALAARHQHEPDQVGWNEMAHASDLFTPVHATRAIPESTQMTNSNRARSRFNRR